MGEGKEGSKPHSGRGHHNYACIKISKVLKTLRPGSSKEAKRRTVGAMNLMSQTGLEESLTSRRRALRASPQCCQRRMRHLKMLPLQLKRRFLTQLPGSGQIYLFRVTHSQGSN